MILNPPKIHLIITDKKSYIMEKYINYVEVNESYNPAQTFKSYVISNFNETEYKNMFNIIRRPFVERILAQPKTKQHEGESGMSELTAIDMVGAIYVYIMDYDQSDPFVQFLKEMFDIGSKYLSDFPSKHDDLTFVGKEIYRLLQLIGEDVFYELLVKELDTVDVEMVNQTSGGAKSGKSAIDGMRKRQAQAFIYNHCVPATYGFWNDQHWAGPSAFWKKLDEYNIDHNLTKTPQYFNWPYNPKVTFEAPYKIYYFEVNFINNNGRPAVMYGTLTASGAGKVGEIKDDKPDDKKDDKPDDKKVEYHDPLDKYDVTVVVG